MFKVIVDLIRTLYHWTLKWSKHRHATKALSALAFFEASIFPLPVDPLLLAMGFSKPKSSFYYSFIASLFSVIGAMGGYIIGTYAWAAISPFFYNFVFPESAFQKVAAVMQSNGATFVSLFVAGFSPIPFKIFTIAGGVASVPLIPFVAACVLSRSLRYFILGGIIYYAGPKAQSWIENNFEKMTLIVSAILVLVVLGLYGATHFLGHGSPNN